MSNGNGKTDWRTEGMKQLFQAPLYVLLIGLICVVLWTNHQEQQRRLDIEEQRNEEMGSLFVTIKDNTKRNADAMEQMAWEAKSEAADTKRQADAIEKRNELLKQQIEIQRGR